MPRLSTDEGRRPRWPLALLILAVCGVPRVLVAAPVTFNTALPVSQGEALLRGQAKYLRATDDPGPLDRKLTVKAVPLVAAWGATSRWTLFAVVPWLDKRLRTNSAQGRVSRAANGWGDLTAIARYTAYAQDAPGRTLRVAPFAGIEAPTGSDDERDGLGVLPRPLQPGSGSWNPLFGVVLTDQSLDREWGADASYQFNNEADGFGFGDEARLNVSYHARIGSAGPAGGIPHFIYAGLEGNLIWQDKNRSGSTDDPDSGGTTLYLVPVLQYVTMRTVTGAAMQFPVLQNLNGDALEGGSIATLSLRVNF